MYPLTRMRCRCRFWNAGGGPIFGALLLEDDAFMLQEDGSYILLS
jgi:hypothetical protein